MRQLIEEEPELAKTPLASDGTKLREEVVEVEEPEPTAIFEEVRSPRPDVADDDMGELCTGPGDVRSVTVAEALYAFLTDFEEGRGSRVYLEKRADDGEVVNFTEKPAENSFARRYREMRYGQLMGFEREIPAAFDRPALALFGVTASGTDADGRPRPPADHMREIADAWSESGGVRETLRNLMESRLGLDPDDWAYIRGGEPHPGDGANWAYHHDHPAVVFDVAAVDGDRRDDVECQLREEVVPSIFLPVIEAHVENCPTAKMEAHSILDVTLREVDDEEGVGSVGTYVGEYVAADVDRDLLEEPLSYLVWGATTWATTTQKFTAGRTARAMIDADRCRSEASEGKHRPHGERLHLKADAWGRETVVCAHCGSHHDVPDTHAEARNSRARTFRSEGDESDDGDGDGYRSRWPSARAAAKVGSPVGEPDAPVERAAFERPEPPPEWEAVELRTGDGETHPIGTPGSVTYRTVTECPWSGDGCQQRVDRLVESFEEPEQPADTRKAVIDALRDLQGPATAADVAERVGIDDDLAARWLQNLKTKGRIISSGSGWVPAD